MHGLDVIHRKNAEAAGREAGHALNDARREAGTVSKARFQAIERADAQAALYTAPSELPALVDIYERGLRRGREEG